MGESWPEAYRRPRVSDANPTRPALYYAEQPNPKQKSFGLPRCGPNSKSPQWEHASIASGKQVAPLVDEQQANRKSTVATKSVYITGYAYETVANKPIVTGQRKGPDVITVQPTSTPATLGTSCAVGFAPRRR